MMRSIMTEHEHSRRHCDVGLVVIGGLKIVKGVVLLAVGIGTLSLLDKDAMARVLHWAHLLQLDLHSRVAQKLLLRLGVAQNRDIGLVSGTIFSYAALLLTEGIGLLLEKVWAEYLAFVITASFI